MADIVLTGDTSGAITVAAPAVAGTNTLTLPASTGTMITSATAAADVPKPTALSTASGSAPSYSARAWVNFDGTAAAASMIRGSGNVSSMTDTGTGNYRVNYDIVMSDSNYAAVAGTSNDSTIRLDSHATTNIRVVANATAANAAIISVAIFR
tara:strand:+ start:549 stop:1007 length:459 start_codon:yes stop_codon:yes gene_type:complete